MIYYMYVLRSKFFLGNLILRVMEYHVFTVGKLLICNIVNVFRMEMIIFVSFVYVIVICIVGEILISI